MLGDAGSKLLGMFSSKFRRACGAGRNSFTGDTLVSTSSGLIPVEVFARYHFFGYFYIYEQKTL